MSKWRELIHTHYPPSSVFDFSPIDKPELRRFVRIIMTEGIPFACSQFPIQFEFARGRAAEALGINPKQISLTGSARIGYSLAPKKFGTNFDYAKSDIDLFVVNESKFQGLVKDFHEFIAAWTKGVITPSNAQEEIYWSSSRERDPNNIKEGFLDANHIPADKRFPTAHKAAYAAIVFEKNLEALVGRKVGSKTKIRIYRDWNAAIGRITYNIHRALKYRKK